MSTSTFQEKAEIVKLRLEYYYKDLVDMTQDRAQRLENLEKQIDEECLSAERKAKKLQNFGRKESDFLRLRRTRLGVDDFATLKVIGKGAFGTVKLVQKKDTGKIYALKALKKADMIKRDQLAHIKAERDLLALSENCAWIVQLYFSFQDPTFLFLIMEYLPGGDLMSLLIKEDIFSEETTRFYLSELILAIEFVHSLDFIHRDIKPDNVLIDRDGHLKLTDFGLATGLHKTHESEYWSSTIKENRVVEKVSLLSSKQKAASWKKNRRQMAFSTVGTPDYIAPEVFTGKGYGKQCDLWSLGAIMFECLCGFAPFCSDSAQETYLKVTQYQTYLQIPEDVYISPEAEAVIFGLMCDADKRMTIAQLKTNKFFGDVDFTQIRHTKAPHVPELDSMTDTRHFNVDEIVLDDDDDQYVVEHKDLAFVGFTFKRFDYLTVKNVL